MNIYKNGQLTGWENKMQRRLRMFRQMQKLMEWVLGGNYFTSLIMERALNEKNNTTKA